MQDFNRGTQFQAWLGTLPEPVGHGATAQAAADDAAAELAGQGFIGAGDGQFATETDLRDALDICVHPDA